MIHTHSLKQTPNPTFPKPPSTFPWISTGVAWILYGCLRSPHYYLLSMKPVLHQVHCVRVCPQLSSQRCVCNNITVGFSSMSCPASKSHCITARNTLLITKCDCKIRGAVSKPSFFPHLMGVPPSATHILLTFILLLPTKSGRTHLSLWLFC